MKNSSWKSIVFLAPLFACGSDTTGNAPVATLPAGQVQNANGTASATDANAIAANGAASAAKNTHAVTISGFAFSPANLSIAAGDSIVFTNQDSATHDMAVKAGEGYTQDSGSIAHGAAKTMVFTKAGSFTLYCTLHSNMTFALTVQ